MPTQSDVARLAGVSTATVSRVINGRGVVTDAVRVRVEQAVETLQYVPHAGARALALQRSGLLGAVVPTLNNAGFAAGINAFERAAESMGYALILSVTHNDPTVHFKQVLRMIERGVDGLLLVGIDHEPAVFQRLEKAAVRHLCGWSFDQQASAATIGFDSAQAMYGVVDHLVGHGHTRIGLLCDNTRFNDQARDQVRGVVSRLNHHGLALPPRYVVEVDGFIKNSRRAFWDLIENDLSAMICSNDAIAQGALLEALKMGMEIPGDLSIIGFDDQELSAELQPALSSVRVDSHGIGDQAARALIRALESKAPVASLELPARLVIRQTTGACMPLVE